MQSLIVAAIVIVCVLYASWSLMPAGWRRALAQRLRHWPGLGRWRAVQRAAGGGGAGCGGCGDCGEAPIQIVRRPR
ncbi:hypothetical protein KAK06_08915 [Ideonella sp. 4Y11]|uniref:Uncharacterized protein n=1 Tax=Ideonella aquatica TaxID=2824119 RepID=A0A940YTJ8_9BURK|nr:DUF6587 family protein [Ideonella aquatica]MBQ0959080.1 hypothetical protein [Ideonella aquatica]